MKVSIKNLKELQEFAHLFLRKLKPHESKATVVLLSGDLGSGKTAFVKEVALELGVEEEVTSPTFVILKRYTIHARLPPARHRQAQALAGGTSDASGNGGQATRYMSLIHIDAYRLKNAEELIKLRFNELLSNPKNIIFIEWPDNVEGTILTDAVVLKFTFIDETTREITFDN